MNNEQRILNILHLNGGLDDDQLSEQSGVAPRQQVNQICRRLATRGSITRHASSHGKIVNTLSAAGSQADAPTVPAQIISPYHPTHRSRPSLTPILPCDPTKTLFLVPCCKTKRSEGRSDAERAGIVDQIPTDLALQLTEARMKLSASAALDERFQLPAFERYQGYFYREAGRVLSASRERGLHVLIISGGYGLLLAEELIGTYEAQFSPGRWPPKLLGDILLSYAQRHGLRHVRAFFAATTSYRKVVTGLDWKEAGVDDALLISPQVTGGGSQRKSPQAQAEAFCAALKGQLHTEWRSRSGIPVSVETL